MNSLSFASRADRRRSVLALLFVLAAACAGAGATKSDSNTDGPGSAARRGTAIKPWTDRFQKPSVLVADEIEIEGPDGLIDHVATRVDPEFHERLERTTTEGYRQEIAQKGPRVSGVPLSEIKVFLDQFEIAALRKCVILARPGNVPVKLTARGNVYWTDSTTHEEKRGDQLRFEGTISR